MATLSEITEGTTPHFTATLKDEAGATVAGASLTAARLTYYSVQSGAIVNARSNQNVLNANNVTISGAGAVLWKLLEADTILVDNPKPTVGLYRAVFVFEWLDAQSVPRQLVQESTFAIRRALNAPFTA